MTLDPYDQIMSDLVDELRELLDAGIEDERTGTDFSSGERFITVSKRLQEMARSRPDTKPVRRIIDGRPQTISMRDVVFNERKERHEKEAPMREARAEALAAIVKESAGPR